MEGSSRERTSWQPVIQWSQHVTLDKAGTVYAAFSYAERWISQAMARYLKDEKQIELRTVSIWSNSETEDGLSLIDQIPSEGLSPEEEANHRQNFERFLERLRKNSDQLEVAKSASKDAPARRSPP